MSSRVHQGPGLAKCGVAHPFTRRVLNLVRCSDALWSQWLEHLDLVSEGATVREGDHQVYRGTTSMIVLTDQHGGSLPRSALEHATQMASRDPHFCLRATRIGRREAVSRSPGPLDSLQLDLQIALDLRGIRVDIDVEGQVIAGRKLVKTKL